MLICKECGSREFFAEFEVPVKVVGRVWDFGAAIDQMPDRARTRYPTLRNIKVECKTQLTNLDWTKARTVKCSRCRSTKYTRVDVCPECSIETTEMAWCFEGSRVVCPNCAGETWCKGCDYTDCKLPKKKNRGIKPRRKRTGISNAKFDTGQVYAQGTSVTVDGDFIERAARSPEPEILPDSSWPDRPMRRVPVDGESILPELPDEDEGGPY